MPQAPSANMGIIWPVDHNDADAWDVIMDQAIRSTVDAHDHSAGKGVLVPTSGLKIDADISWSFGGVSRAITDLRALDFSPQAAADMTALAGALFLNSADSELYYRTTAGSNVKLTAGAALNVAAFTGGFGGDYAAAGALALFDDATDSYWFQQQVGAAVRQYARMRSADVDLYEFKANPTAGVPTNRVRLASPAALAASYALTMPAALPASLATLKVDASGAITAVVPPARQFPASFIQPASGSAATFSPGGSGILALQTSAVENWCPILMSVGEVLTSWTMFLSKATIAGTITAQLFDLNMSTGSPAQIGVNQTNSANNPGNIQLGQSGLSTTIATGHAYYLVVTGTGSAGDFVRGYQITNT